MTKVLSYVFSKLRNFSITYVISAIVELGGKCVIASRSIDKINNAVEELKPYCTGSAEISGLSVNIKSRESVSEMISATLERHGRLDGLVNNGGGQFVSPGEHISENGWKVFSGFSWFLNKTYRNLQKNTKV